MKQIWYHKDCLDGFGALSAFLSSAQAQSDFKAIAMNHGDDFDLTGIDELIMLDFSVKAAVMREICQQVSRVLVIDHHKTAKVELDRCTDLKNMSLIYDVKKSGAVLSWEYFHSDKEVPLILYYIQDRDLWNWKMEKSHEVNAFLSHQGFGNPEWLRKLISSFDLRSILAESELILDTQRKIYLSICHNAMEDKLDNYPILSVNSPVFQSEIGDYLNKKILSENLPQKFVLIWWEHKGQRIVCLRSQGDFDVSEIAKSYGGGGHKNAAGFIINIKE